MLDKIMGVISIIACIVVFVVIIHMWFRPAIEDSPVNNTTVIEREYDPYGDIPAEELVRGDAEAYK